LILVIIAQIYPEDRHSGYGTSSRLYPLSSPLLAMAFVHGTNPTTMLAGTGSAVFPADAALLR